MSRFITFSRTFPSYHPKAGQPTYFVEQIQNSLCSMNLPLYAGIHPPFSFLESLTKQTVGYKHHTIRAGHRWKVGDWFTPKVWGNDINPKSGRSGPYHSKQIQFAPDIQVKKVWDFECHTEADDRESDWSFIIFQGQHFTCYGNEYLKPIIKMIALNDGFSDPQDFIEWLRPRNRNSEPLLGQIICWNETIEY